jgi:hypothetical protein
LPPTLSLHDVIRLIYPPGYNIDHFEWSFIPQSGGAASSPLAHAAATSFATASVEADLSLRALTAGPYAISVIAVDAWAGRSAPGTAQVTLIAAEGSLGHIRVYPNPWRSDQDTDPHMVFDHLAANTTIKIFTIAGQLVRTLSGNDAAQWDLHNSAGDRVGSGIYLFLAEDGQGSRARGKIAVLH